MRRFIALMPLVALLSACVDIPQAPKRQPVRRSTLVYTPRPDQQQCLTGLGAAQAAFTPLPDQYFGAGCSTLGTVRLTSLRSDHAALGLSNIGPVTCPLANALAGWARFGVDRAARQILGTPLAQIETMGSYSCRTVAGSSRMSAHATANAVDIGGFVLADGRHISILADWDSPSPQVRAFLRTVRDSGCKRFDTVLSPEYNAAHRNHLHVEVGYGRPLCS